MHENNLDVRPDCNTGIRASGVRKIMDVRMTWLLFGICWMVYFSGYIGRLNYSSAMPDMINVGWISITQAGSISTVFFIFYAVGQMINGLLGDRFKPGSLVFIGVVLSALSNLLMPFSPNYAFALVCWAINGYALSMLWPPIVRIFADMLDEGSMIKCCVHITSSTAAGNLCAYLLSAFLIKFYNWKMVFIGASVLLFFVAVVWRLVFRRVEHYRDEFGVTVVEGTRAARHEFRGGVLKLLLSSGALLFLIPVVIHGSLKDGITAWIPTMIVQTFSVSSSKAVLVSSILPVINLTGAYAASFVYKKWINNESLSAAFFFLVALASLVGIICFGKVNILLSVAFLSVITSSMLAVNTLLISLMPLRFRMQGRVATISGFFNSAAYLGSAVTTMGTGWLAGEYGWDAVMLCFVALTLVACLTCLLGRRIKLPE